MKAEPAGKKDSGNAGAKREMSMQAATSKRESSSQPTASSRPKPPSKIANGRFEIDKRLGAGCFGEVFRGVNADTKQEVAVKFEDLQTRTQQLEQEAAIMSLLRQPLQPQGFSECFYFGREGRYNCMVMELLGKSLEDCVQERKGRFSPLTTAMVADQLIRRVEYLHSKGIVHRDIKPENLTLSDDISGAGLTVKLGGFELAMSQQDNQRCKSACGTLPFAAPEAIVSDANGYDGMAADMWSLGILLMEVACGLRSVEQALELASHGSTEQKSDKKAQPPKPSLEVANKIRATFDEANFLGQFFAKCTPEARKVQDWLMPVVATLVRTNPLRRLDASALRDLMSSAPDD